MKDVLYLVIAQTLGTTIVTLVTTIMGYIKNILWDYEKYWYKLRGYVFYEVETNSRINSATHISNKTIQHVTEYMRKFPIKGNAKVYDAGPNAKPMVVAEDWVKVEKNLYVKFSKQIDKDKNGDELGQKLKYSICGVGNKIIEDFLIKCKDNYDIMVENVRIEKKLFRLDSFDRDIPEYAEYNFDSDVTFDTLFFPQKEVILNLLEKLRTKKIKKLNILLTGRPGCGKTSIIKAIINLTKRNTFEIDISKVLKGSQLTKIFFDTCNFSYKRMPNSARMFVIEEIDTVGKLVAKRQSDNNFEIINDYNNDKINNCNNNVSSNNDKNNNSINNNNNNDKNKGKRIKKYNGEDENHCVIKGDGNDITLGNLLTTFDGILELNDTITIITTNHPELLDPALIREGRIHLHCVLGPCLAKDAISIIKTYFPDYDPKTYPLGDEEITPARLQSYCFRAYNVDNLNQRLVGKWEE